MFDDDDVARYRDRGYLLAERCIAPDLLAELTAEVERIASRACTMTEHDDDIELDVGHTPRSPRIQRIKAPHRKPFFRDWLARSGILENAARLIGPDMRLHSSKINMKAGGGGSEIAWHQDWGFYPHTNDDILAAAVMLDDVGLDNAPLMVFPGTHTGPTFDHHSGNPHFVGSVDLAAEGLDMRDAVSLTAPAGSVSYHHVRLLHGSGVNRSGRPRRILFFELTAADAWPLCGTYSPFTDLEEYDARLVAGRPTIAPRVVACPIRVPQPKPPTIASIFEIQRQRRSA